MAFSGQLVFSLKASALASSFGADIVSRQQKDRFTNRFLQLFFRF